MAIQRSRAERIGNGVFYILLVLLCIVTLYPFYYVLCYSVSEGAEAAAKVVTVYPRGFTIHADEKAKLVANNIREGVTILGVAGSMTGTEGANPQAKTVTPSTSQQEILPDSESGYNYLSQVTVLAIPYSEAENPQGGTTVTIG